MKLGYHWISQESTYIILTIIFWSRYKISTSTDISFHLILSEYQSLLLKEALDSSASLPPGPWVTVIILEDHMIK